ncbi:Proline/betaine transporter [compost metagenome]
MQGVATGGEWGGATLMAMENAPKHKRGFYAAIVQIGAPTGTLLSSGAVALAASLPGDAFLDWAWRVPFLVSIMLVGLAVWLRWNIDETPEFKKLAAQKQTEALPVIEVLRGVPGRLLIGIAAYLFSNAGFFIITTFMIGYVTRTLEMPSTVILQALTIGAVAQMVVLALAGKLADRIGAGRTVALGYLISLLLAFPIFALVDTKDSTLITLAMVCGIGLASIAYAPIGALLTQLFPARLHYSGLGLSANLAGLIAGFMPAAATWFLMLADNQSWGPATLLAAIAFVSLAGTLLAMRVIKKDASNAVGE